MATRVPFRELVSDAVGGGWGQEAPFVDSIPVAVIRGTDFEDVRNGEFARVPRRHEARRKAARRRLQVNDLLLEVSGGSPTSGQTTGRSLLVTERMIEALGGSVIPASFCRLVRIDENRADPRYAYFALQDMYASGRAGDYEHRSTGISNFQFEFFLDQELVALPPLTDQRRIAGILGSLDDKIELNRRMSQTLESMARALFNSWFVDFDPVRAKAGGDDPGLPECCSALFPKSFEDSELGQVPAGWPVHTFGDLCSRVAIGPFGSDITVDNFIDSGVPVVRGNNLRDGFLDEQFAFISPAKADQLRNANAFPGDLIVTHRGTLGQVGLIPRASRYPRYVASQSQMLASVDASRATPEYVYQYLRSAAGQHALLANVSQTGVPAIARPTTSLRAIRVLAPPLSVQEAFARFAGTAMGCLDAQLWESRGLASIRAKLVERLFSPSPSTLSDVRARTA